MKKKLKKLIVSVLASAMIMTLLPVNQLSVRAEQKNGLTNVANTVSDSNVVEEYAIVYLSEGELSGTFGDNDGFNWSYDESTATLTVTGEDSELNTMQSNLPATVLENMRNIVFRDCVVSGRMDWLLSELEELESVEFHNFDTRNVRDMGGMFSGCSSLKDLDLGSFDTRNVTNMSNMFHNCSSLGSVDLSSFNTANVTSMDSMFNGCSSLSSLDVSSFDTVNVGNMNAMFNGCSSLSRLDVGSFNTVNVVFMGDMFAGCSSLSELDVSSFDTKKVRDMWNMFKDCSSLNKLDVSDFDTGNVETMQSMFKDCSSLSTLDVSNFDTGKVTDMNGMFVRCSSLSELDVSGFDTSNVTDMGYMFASCSGLSELDVSNFNTDNVTNMYGMFMCCNSLSSLDVSEFNTSNVKQTKAMFTECSSLRELNVSNFDTSNVRDMRAMFADCSSLISLDVSNFDTGNVADMSFMFSECGKLSELDLSSFEIGNANVDTMFYNNENLVTIKTPKSIDNGKSIVLPAEFYDSKENLVKEITSEHCNKTLARAIKKYAITYHLDGGKNNAANPVTYTEGSDTIALKSPTKTGYTFAGWYSDSKFKKKVTQIKKGSKWNKEFYAKWTPIKYTIKFDKNGGASGKMDAMKNRKYGTKYTLPKNTFKRRGYTFTGWNTKKSGKGNTYKDNASVKNLVSQNGSSITLYAQWEKESYKITYKLNGGKNSKSNPKKYSVTTKTTKLKAPTRKGYTFKGWYKDKKLKKKVTQIKKGSTGKITLYAKWQEESYKITYKLNGGMNSKSNPTKYTATTKTTKLKAPTKKGYTFKGWYKDKKFKKKVTQIKKGSTGNITLYAKWVKNK